VCPPHLSNQFFLCQLCLRICIHIGFDCTFISFASVNEAAHPPSKLNTSRLPLPCNSTSALSFTICFATDVAKLPTSRMRAMRGFLLLFTRYLIIQDGMYLNTP